MHGSENAGVHTTKIIATKVQPDYHMNPKILGCIFLTSNATMCKKATILKNLIISKWIKNSNERIFSGIPVKAYTYRPSHCHSGLRQLESHHLVTGHSQ
mgnify:CR=1 FL=1